MYITVDRFEGETAVVQTEDGKMYNMPRALLPNVGEGSVISIHVDEHRTKQRHDDVQALVDELFKD